MEAHFMMGYLYEKGI